MKLISILFFIVLRLVISDNYCIGQIVDKKYVISNSEIRNTTFANYDLADSFSKAGDSIKASKCYLQIDPYFLISMGMTAQNIDTNSQFLITSQVKKEYRSRFLKAYNAPRSDAYSEFKKMYEEDQDTRIKYENCGDNYSCFLYLQKWKDADSTHFQYLNNYIKKYGWPTYANGSTYAQIIELHDADHWKENLPILKKAVLIGNMNFNIYENILNKVYKPTRAELFEIYKNKIDFDVSYILRGIAPKEDSVLIKKAVKDHQPIKYLYFTITAKNENEYNKFMNSNDYWILWGKILIFINRCQEAITKTRSDIPYNFIFSKDTIHASKIKVDLIY